MEEIAKTNLFLNLNLEGIQSNLIIKLLLIKYGKNSLNQKYATELYASGGNPHKYSYTHPQQKAITNLILEDVIQQVITGLFI